MHSVRTRIVQFSGALAAMFLLGCGGGGGGTTPTLAFVAASGNSGGTVFAYAMDTKTGVLTPVAVSPISVAPSWSVAFDPKGPFAYSVSGSSSISGYMINPMTGTLAPIDGSPFAAVAGLNATPANVIVDPTGRFAYTPNTTSCAHLFAVCSYGNVSTYSIDAATGALTSIAGNPVVVNASLYFTPTGQFAYSTNRANPPDPANGPGSMTGYTVNAVTGALTTIVGSPFAAGTDPLAVTADPSGRFIYVADGYSNKILAYSINASTGVPTPIADSPFATNGTWPTSITFDPTGRFVYVANAISNNVSAFAVDAATGVLTPIAGSPFPAGTGSSFVMVDPSGKFAYVTNYNSNDISAYAINTTTGALAPIAGSPFATGTFPRSIAIK